MGKIRLNDTRFTDFDFKKKLSNASVGAEGVIIADKVCPRKND
jgi:hypothetical protein